jgi:hypothetical protein
MRCLHYAPPKGGGGTRRAAPSSGCRCDALGGCRRRRGGWEPAWGRRGATAPARAAAAAVPTAQQSIPGGGRGQHACGPWNTSSPPAVPGAAYPTASYIRPVMKPPVDPCAASHPWSGFASDTLPGGTSLQNNIPLPSASGKPQLLAFQALRRPGLGRRPVVLVPPHQLLCVRAFGGGGRPARAYSQRPDPD